MHATEFDILKNSARYNEKFCKYFGFHEWRLKDSRRGRHILRDLNVTLHLVRY
jgi:hypothetical protein